MTYMEYARRQKEWTQKDLGEHPRVRIHQNFISMIERGAVLPMPDQRQRIAGALGIPAETLLEPVPTATVVAERG